MAEVGGHIKEGQILPNIVIIILAEKNFNFRNNWKNIARKLKVPLLEIQKLADKQNQDNDYEIALEKCVDYWIRNDPNPSYEKLIPIIADVDKPTARHMKERLGLHNVIIQNDILDSLTDLQLKQLGRAPVADLLTKLEAESILTSFGIEELSECDTWKGVIEYVREIIKDDKEKKLKFGKVILHYKETNSIGRKVIKEVGEPAPVILSPNLRPKFDSILISFGTLMFNIRSKLLPCLPSCDVFKEYVVLLPDILKEGVNDCTTNKDVLKIIEATSGILNLTKFEAIAKQFKCQEVLDDIKEYNSVIDQSCIDIKDNLVQISSLCNSPYISEPLRCESLEFDLQWNPKEDTLGKIRLILWKAFEHIANEIIVVRLWTCSIVVLCYIPHTLVPIAVYKAKKNLESLQKLGMIRLSIGYITILEKKKKEFLDEEKLPLLQVRERKDSVDTNVHEVLENVKESLEVTKQKLKEKEEECRLLQADQLQSQSEKQDDLQQNLELSLIADNKSLLEKNQTLIVERNEFKEHFEAKSNELESVISHQEELKRQTTILQEKLNDLSKESTLQIESKEEKIKELKKEIEKSQSQLHKWDSLIATQKEDIEKFKKDLERAQRDSLNQKEEMDKLKKFSARAQSQIHEKDSFIATQKKQLEETQSQVHEKDSMIAIKMKKITELTEKFEKEENKVNMQEETVRTKQLENENLTRENEDFAEKLRQNLRTLHDDYIDSRYPPVQVIMTSFDAYKKSDEPWYSPSFLSHENSYKMCLKVRANGEEEGQGTHLSVSVHFMIGENDDQLYWPFRGTVNIEVVNRRRLGGNFTGQIVFSDTSNQEASQRVFNGIPVRTGMASIMGQGGIKFMPQETLNYNSQDNTEYLRDDSIKLKIVSVTVDPISRIKIPTLPSSEALVEFKIDNFESRKKANAECISDPFYSGPNKSGYKFVLMVYPNGRGDYKGKSISVFIHLMKGENDQGLHWPFRGEFVTQIVNSIKEQNHVEKLIEFSEDTDPSGKYGARVAGITTYFSSGRSFQGYGFPNFVTHEYLEANEDRDTKYLNDDGSLMLRIMKITVHS